MKVISSTWVYQGFYSLRQDHLEKTDGTSHPYTSLILAHDAVVVLAQDKEKRWVLVREYRHPTGKHLLGCAGGTMEPGESPIEAGQRELFEETGYWSDDMELLGANYPFPGICNQKIYFLLAKNAVFRGEKNLDPLELMETELWEDAQLREEIKSSDTINGLLCAALWYAAAIKAHRQLLKRSARKRSFL